MIKHKNKGHQLSKIVAVRNDRLGGRLGAILNVMRIAQTIMPTLVLHGLTMLMLALNCRTLSIYLVRIF